MTLNNKMAVKKILIALALASMTQVQAAQPVTNYEYDANGNSTKVTDGLSHATTQEYDAIDRLKKQSQPHPTSTGQLGQINRTYNAVDDVTGVTDPRSLATGYTKNAFGNILSQTSPDTGTSSYTYDNAGNVLTKTDARGAVATYTYDALNRLTGISYKPSASAAVEEAVAYYYDVGNKGRLTGMTDAVGGVSWYYDTQGRSIGKRQLVAGRVADLKIQYNTLGQVSRIVYPSAHYVDYGYSTNGKINQIAIDSTIMISSITYHPTGAIKGYNWGNGQTYQQKIDSDGRPTSYTMGDQLQVVTYDNAGRITQIHRASTAAPTTPISGTISTYSYDNLDRLTGNTTPTTNAGYQYDLNHNRTQLTIGATNYAYTVSSTSNRLNAEAGPTARTYTYDAGGNITGNGQDIYTYASSGRLKQVTRAGNTIMTQFYNGLGEMVASNYAIGYMYDDAGRLLGEYDSNGDILQENIYLGNIPVLAIKPDSAQVTSDNVSTQVTGAWTTQTTNDGYYGGNYLVHAPSSSTSDKVVFTLTPLTTQTHKVYARWTGFAGNASNATYTINTNVPGSTLQTAVVNQQYDSGAWIYLGSYPLYSSYPVTVSLSGQGNGNVVADAIRIVPASTTNIQNNTYFVHTDHLNTPRLVASYNNTKRWTWYPETSEAFGANTPNENPAAAGTFTYNLRFPGQIYLPATQLSYNYYRDYNPRTGRYIESDPIGLDAGQMSTYAYVDGNPLSSIDPMGLSDVVFNRGLGTITITDSSGGVVGTYPAANNTTSTSKGSWPNGTYPYSHYQPHPESGPSGAYGSNGNFVFDVPGRTGMGIHSGRRGPQSKTLGCVRTTDEATEFLRNLHQTDPLRTITVQ